MTEPMIPIEPAPAPARTGMPRWFSHLLVASGSLVVGAALAVGVLFAGGWRHVPVNGYNVSVILKPNATAQQKDAARAILEKVDPDRGVTVVTREEAFAEIKKTYQEVGQDFPESVTAASMPETLKTSTRGRSFDCKTVSALHDNKGVDELLVGEVEAKTHRGARIGC